MLGDEIIPFCDLQEPVVSGQIPRSRGRSSTAAVTGLLHKVAYLHASQAMDVCKLVGIVSSLLCTDVDAVPVRLSPDSVKVFVPTQKLACRWACCEEQGFMTGWRIYQTFSLSTKIPSFIRCEDPFPCSQESTADPFREPSEYHCLELMQSFF
jgi:hypothetical protein